MAKTEESMSPRHQKKMSLLSYLSKEVTRGYVLDHDEERYTTRRQKMYTFMKIPRELEKFMSYGFFHCLDSFLFVFTFLPIRFFLAICALVVRAPLVFLGLLRPQHGRLLYPAEKIDLLKGLIIAICAYVLSHVDTSMMYHLIKSQSVIKLYLFYNMLEVGDRLFSAFGQDTIDALFWTATEPTLRKREHIGVIPHFLLTITYVIMAHGINIIHTLLVLLQATTLNVAINASNKALLTIMMSNNFVELKGSVFKKFDKDNLFQVSCSDVRERFHLFSLLFIVVVQTMKEYAWKEESFLSLAPDCLLVLFAEFLVDWIKHAFITRFNEVSAEVYKDYTTYLAYDLAQTKQKHAFSDHSDIVSRRMGFIPLPLGVVMIRVISNAVRVNSRGAPVIFLLAYLCLLTFRILASVVILGKACDLIDHHQHTKTNSAASPQKRKTSHEKNPNRHSSDVPITLGEENELPVTPEDESETVEALIEEFTQPFNVTLEENFDVNGKISPALSCPTDDLFEKLDAISKSSSVILEEEEDLDIDDVHEVNGGTDSDDDNHTKTVLRHRWSNNRANMFVARGELNKTVYTTSRKRPLSCTPPSTSISTSASIEEDEEGKNQLFHVPETENQCVDLAGPAQTVPIFLPDLIQPAQSHQQQLSGHHSPVLPENDLLAASEVSLHPTIDEFLNLSSKLEKSVPTIGDDGTVKVNDDFMLFQGTIGQRSMSSPDFLLQYQNPYDEERDWPQVDREDETLELEPLLLHDRKLHQKDTPDGQIAASKQSVLPRRGSGCAADDHRLLRNRKRFDTDRL